LSAIIIQENKSEPLDKSLAVLQTDGTNGF